MTMPACPVDVDVNRDPLTGGLGGCVFGRQRAGRSCLDRSLQSIRGSTFRARGGSLVFSGSRGLWSFGVGAGYVHRRYARPAVPAFDRLRADRRELVSLRLGRPPAQPHLGGQFRRLCQLVSNDVGSGLGRSAPAPRSSYNRSLFLERLRLLAAVGLYHSDDGIDSSTNASALAGLRYTF